MKYTAFLVALAPLFGAVLADDVADGACVWSCMNQALKYSSCTDVKNLSCICVDPDFFNECSECIGAVCSETALKYATDAKDVECANI
ncbi:hypothetical protein ASPWEDRAFT_185185 [Aspergillus wentii DTO 134E9]|uniref:CFEM domain-containing protein n=1 Tax=Aspergillus wentii DTO 134E9 TaxID=1073089 RepID=A0A1L9RCU9_ASPWE|nr:uncharacterized protein ASPWEDRAFT_185185 [Aspergillus wentii DTO 134E9]KAI9924277.1 hypothetical protein MW887_007227 [Aspergillus wentii]OJJ32697.1 hypothetical protein ASPWEDRAFT_185185 [Aspergillus wentii DTO 134E9]